MYSIKQSSVEFVTDGLEYEPPFPGLCIKDIGEISLPLCELQAQNVIEKLKGMQLKNPETK